MNYGNININNIKFPYVELNTLIVGSGAAALNAAIQLYNKGITNIAIATDNWGGGTSNNAGSDKQTYYKLSLSGKENDSPYDMSEDLFKGGCMHGDIALCEAQHSAEAFYNLVNIGVPFPHDKYGGFVGYKTDHDTKGRATSAGPLTSHLMFQRLAKEIIRRGIPIFDNHEVVELLAGQNSEQKKVIGAIAINKKNIGTNNINNNNNNSKVDSEDYGFVIFNVTNVILCTGGPAGMYKRTVYPESQTGSSGLALKIGAVAQNLTESQFGMGSVKFRWNVSGSYQQVIPRYVSTDQDGNDVKEFLNDSFPDLTSLVNATFLKGYQWPFDARKIANYGSSLIDLLVHKETVVQGRRVFLDFTNNPSMNDSKSDFKFDISLLNKEAYNYLDKSNALGRLPIDRLKELNRPAIDLYKNNGIDIGKEYLEIAVCAQHNNGGLTGNIWWESNVKHLFPVGEIAGTHGVYRPGGASLNAGQVGGIRAAMFISENYNVQPPEKDIFMESAKKQISDALTFANRIIQKDIDKADAKVTDIVDNLKNIRWRMSAYGSHIRKKQQVSKAIKEARNQLIKLNNVLTVESCGYIIEAYKLLDVCITHLVYLEAIAEYIDMGGKSRGSYIVVDNKSDIEDGFELVQESDFVSNHILEISLNNDLTLKKKWVDIRPIPDRDQWFENIWKDFREGKIVK